jgi:outer membrane receptor protein involved in Fe transport
LVFAADPAHASIRRDTNIPAEPLGAALQALATTYDFQVLYRTEIVQDLKTKGASGSLSPKEALGQVLNGTGLSFKYLDDKTVTVFPIGSSDSAGSANAPDITTHAASDGAQEGKKSSGTFRLAQAGEGQTSSDVSVAKQSTGKSQQGATGLSEIIVTAQKKSERLQDVPVPVSVTSADTLTENNQPLIRDYFSTIPGLSVSPAGGSLNQQMLTIRGVSSGAYGNPTVGVTVDDVPYGAFTRELTPDIDPSDLERVEVLRGPQGTLYGASSMGGLLKFVTVDPSTNAVSGRVQAGTSSVYNGAELGYNFSASVNVPLSDTVAIRASGFTRQDPGYIDNPIRDINGINEDHSSGGRLSALWRISDTFSLKLSALYQHTQGDGLSEVDTRRGLGDLQQNYIPGVGPYYQTIEAYSAVLKGKVGSADVTSVTGYNAYRTQTTFDYSSGLGSYAQRLFGVGGVNNYAYDQTDKFTQEVRASVPIGKSLEWLLGGFYTNENTPYQVNELATNTATGAVVGNVLYANIPIKYTEYAAFTDVTVHITDRFKVQLGGRESYLNENFEAVTEGGALFKNPITEAAIKSTPNVFTYLVTPQFNLSSDLMVYARAASGYRPGRANQSNPDPLVPRAANPDSTQNYEVGAKGDLLQHVLSFDASLYYINFKNIQINLLDPRNSISYYANGGNAKSEGAELSVEAQPLTGLTIAAWVTYDDAVLTSAFPATTAAYGPAGSRLPYAARFSGNLVLDQRFPVTDNVGGFAGITWSYVGDRRGTFVSTPQQYYPPYSKVDLHAGLKCGSWTANLYANNVADKRGIIGGGLGTYPPDSFYIIQPRTIGVSIVREF